MTDQHPRLLDGIDDPAAGASRQRGIEGAT